MSKDITDELTDAETRISILESALEAISNDIEARGKGKGKRNDDDFLRDLRVCADKALSRSAAVVE